MKTFLDEIMFDIDGLRKINTLTKYPSILTYHNLGPKGSLVDTLVEDKSFDERPVYITEKIDGTNSRIVFFTDEKGSVADYLIGSREDLLYAKGDRIVVDTMGVVKNMKSIADTVSLLGEDKLRPNSIYCLYGETYGGKINGTKQYSGHGNFGIRIFDLWYISNDEANKILAEEVERISSWREHAGQPFASVKELSEFCCDYLLERVPYIEEIPGADIPTSLQDVWNWMQKFANSAAKLDNDGKGLSEGIIVRYADRSLIRKIRFEDYQKTKRLGLIH